VAELLGAAGGRVVWWSGDVPRCCDSCGRGLSAVFVDCKTVRGCWGALCVECAGDQAVASGPPLTRVFQRTEEGWVSIF